MPSTKTIPGIQKGPDFDREAHEPYHVEKAVKGVKLGRQPDLNDPIVNAAVDALAEVSESFGENVDIQYERHSGMIVMTIYEEDGETVERRIPPEEAIRMAQHRKEMRAQYLSSVF